MNETMRGPHHQPLGGPADPQQPGMSPDDADALLAINAHLRSPSPEWVEFLGETLSTWLVEQRSPAGLIDEAKAHWLVSRIDEDGMVTTPGALALLRRCCIKARTVPASLLAYLRNQELSTQMAQSLARLSASIGAERRVTGA